MRIVLPAERGEFLITGAPVAEEEERGKGAIGGAEGGGDRRRGRIGRAGDGIEM